MVSLSAQIHLYSICSILQCRMLLHITYQDSANSNYFRFLTTVINLETAGCQKNFFFFFVKK